MVRNLSILLFLFSFTAFAEPVVIGKEANLISAKKYESQINFRLQRGKELKQSGKFTEPDFSTYKFSLEGLLPIVSKKLSPGIVNKREGIKEAGLKPLCLVGADPLSFEWIAMHKQNLIKIGALCLVVQVETAGELEKLKTALNPIPWQPSSGDFVAEHHQIEHYPVLISRRAIEQ